MYFTVLIILLISGNYFYQPYSHLTLLFCSGSISTKEIKTYFLNKKFDFKSLMSTTDPELECLQSERNFNLPDEISICTRWKPYSYQNIRSYWSLALGIGNRNLFKNVYEDGFLYGVWESGPWIGFKLPGTTAMGWIGGGTAVYDFLVCSLHIFCVMS